MANDNRMTTRTEKGTTTATDTTGTTGSGNKGTGTRKVRRAPLMLELPRHTPDEVNAHLGPVNGAAKSNSQFLSGGQPIGTHRNMKIWKPEKKQFVRDMIAALAANEREIGHTVEIQSVKDDLAVAEAAEESIRIQEASVAATKEVYIDSMGAALKAANKIYNKAKATAKHNGTVALAIEKYIEANTLKAKKGARTRKNKAEQANAVKTQPATPGPAQPEPATVEPTPAPKSSTTTTTTLG